MVRAPRPGPLGTPARLAAAVAVAVCTLVVVPDLAVAVGRLADTSSARLSSAAGSLLSIVAGLVLARTGWTRSSAAVPGSRRLGSALAVIGGGAALLGVGTVAQLASPEVPVGPLAGGALGPVQAVAMVIVAVGTAALPTSRRWDTIGVIDALLLVLAGLTLMWVAPLRGEVEPAGGLVQVLRSDPAMAATVAVILIAAVLLVRVDPDAERALRPVVIALLLYPAAFYTAAVAGLGGGNQAGIMTTELWWVTAPVLLLAVGLRVSPLPGVDGRGARPETAATLTARIQSALPGVAVVVILAGVATHQRFMGRLNPVTMGIGVVTVLLAVLRLAILQREQRGLLGRLRDNAARLSDQARLDRLTGLGNRTALGEYLAALLADPPSTGVSVFFIDLDNFKGINDSLGHDTGDRLLGELAVRLTDVLGPAVYRIGGDEFIGVRADLDTERAEAMAAALVAALRPSMAVDGRQVAAAASVGLARSTVRRRPERGEPDTADALLRRADLALYRAKELGRGRWAAYDPWLQDRADRRLELQQGLRRAVEDGDVQVVFEPVVALPARRVVGAATLLRWETATRGVLEHAEVMSVAGEAGLRHRLLDRVLDEIGPRLAEASSDGHDPFTISVAVGPSDVARPELVERLTELVGATGGSPGLLQVEVPEQAVADDRIAESLDGLVALGVGLVVTGFGNGPSSLRRLARYPASAIEVDRSFVGGIGLRRDDRLILEAVGRLAAELGLELVADGVTTEVQASELVTLGATRASGPLFGPPVPWEELRGALRADRRPVGPTPGPGR